MKTGRPRKFDEEAILERVMNSFWTHGYADTTFEQLVTDSGLSRSSLYNSFGNKEVLFEKAVKLYLEKRFASLRRNMEDPEHGDEALHQFVARFSSTYNPQNKDCLLRKTTLHNASHPEQPKETGKIKGYLKDLWHSLQRGLGHIKPKSTPALTPQERSALLVASMLGSSVISKNGDNEELLATITSAATKLLQEESND